MADYKTFPCDICDSLEAVELPHARLYTKNQPVHVCCNCGFVHVRERRSSHAIAEEWSKRVYGSNYTAHIPAIVARQTYVADWTNVELNLKGKKLIDIGAGEGQFLRFAAERYGASVFGVEPSEKNCELIRKLGYGAFAGTVEEYAASKEFTPGSADVVTIMWTLENCLSCKDMVRMSRDLLKPGGHLVIATGSRIMVPFKKPLQLYFSHEPTDLHCFRFSANALQNIMRMSGLTSIRTNRFLDSDILCVVGTNDPGAKKEELVKDDFRKVYDFFDRWHKESMYY